MSFILDALKKSENARQRQAGPALFEVKVVPPRRTLPAWAIVVGILLVINGVVLSWMLLSRGGARSKPVARRAVPAEVPATRAAEKPAASPTPAAARALPAPTPAVPAATVGGRTSPRSATVVPAAAVPPTAAAPAASQASASPNPADLVPAEQPSAAGGAGGTQPAGGLPLYAHIAAAPGSDLPQLHLDLHVYAPNPDKRFVMINMHKLHQGGSLADGVTVVQIRPDGVVLSYQGRKFLLPR